MSFKSDYEKRKKQLGYKGCKNCVNQIEPLRMCEWAERKTEKTLHLFCPRWEKRSDDREQKED